MHKRSFVRHTLSGVLLVVPILLVTSPAIAADEAANKLLTVASDYYNRGWYDEAKTEYTKFLGKYANHPEAVTARYGLALSHYRLKQYDAAAKHLATVTEKKKFEKRADALAVRGHCLLVTGKYDQALKVYDDLRTNHAKSKHVELASLNRAQVLYLLGKADESQAACEEYLKTYPTSARRGPAQYFLACALASKNDAASLKTAATTLRAFLKDHADSPFAVDATLLMGQILEKQGKFAPAAAQFQAFIDGVEKRRKGEGYFSLGLVQHKDGKFAEAAAALSVVVGQYGSAPYAKAARFQLGLSQLEAGQPAAARTALQQVVRTDPSRKARAAYWLARCDMAEKKYAPARTALAALKDAKPNNLDAILFEMAVCAMETDQWAAAAAEFETFVKDYADSDLVPEAMYRQAFCLHKLTQYADSQVICDAIAKLATPSAQAMKTPTLELAAENLFQLKEYTKAAQAFRALRGKVKGASLNRANYRLGQCEYLSSRYPQAIALLKPVVAANDPMLKDAAFFLGDSQLLARQYAPAAVSFQKYISDGGTRKDEATFKLGIAQLQAKKLPEAQQTLAGLAAATNGSPWAARAMLALGQMTYDPLKQPDEAAKILNKVLAESTKAPAELIPQARYTLGWIDFDAKRFDEAAKHFAECVAKAPKGKLSDHAALQQAYCMKEAKRYPEAIKLLDTFEKNYASSKRKSEAQHLKAKCYAQSKQYAKAVEILKVLAANKRTASDEVLYELAWSYRDAKGKDAQKNAIAAYRQLLKAHRKSKLAAPARTELAELLYLAKEYQEAVGLAEQVVADPGVAPATKAIAHFRVGACYQQLSQPSKAAKAFGDFIATYPDSDLIPSAMYYAGVTATAAGELAKAETFFTDLQTKYAKHDVVPVATLKLGEVQATGEKWEASAATYQGFLDKYAENEFAYRAKVGLGWARENLKQYDKAREMYQAVADNYSNASAAKAQFHVGECYFAEGKYQEAALALVKVYTLFKAHDSWASKALLEAGRAFEATKEPDKARQQYADCIKAYPKTPAAELAKKRLDALNGVAPAPGGGG